MRCRAPSLPTALHKPRSSELRSPSSSRLSSTPLTRPAKRGTCGATGESRSSLAASSPIQERPCSTKGSPTGQPAATPAAYRAVLVCIPGRPGAAEVARPHIRQSHSLVAPLLGGRQSPGARWRSGDIRFFRGPASSRQRRSGRVVCLLRAPLPFATWLPSRSEGAGLRVELAISRGVPEPEIVAWCRRTLEGIFGDDSREVICDAYVACVKRATP